jgi:Ca2+-binding EF-hand superfamily protein
MKSILRILRFDSLFEKSNSENHLQGYTEEEATERAEKIFTSLDRDGDGTLVEEEFIKVDEHVLKTIPT